jgi:hypothetical protein
MRKEDLVWHEEDESVVMEDPDGWKLIFVMNHFKNKFWYEIQAPNNYYLNMFFDSPFEAIDALNKARKEYIYKI